MLQSLKLLRLSPTSFARLRPVVQRRTLIAPTTALQADFVQDLYLRELKSYKPPSIKPSDSEGHVQKFSPPKAPHSPEEGDIANDLKTYEEQQVEVESQAGGEENRAYEDEGWWEELEGDEENPAAH